MSTVVRQLEDSTSNFWTFWKKGIKFWSIGGIGILINMSILWGLTNLGMDYRISGLIGICCAAFSNYVGNILVGNIKVGEK